MARAEIVEITPEVAEEWLLGNTINRHIRVNVVQAYARDMKNGCWDFNGESIKFSPNGQLIDGQHRLQAVIVSGVTIKSLVVFGLPGSAQKTVDVGVKRLYSDQLTLAGEAHTSTLSALLRRILMWENGNYMFTYNRNSRLTHADLAACLEREGERARDAAYLAVKWRRDGAGLHASVLSFCYWLLAQINTEDANWFFSRLADGVGLPAHHPVLVLRERLVKERTSRYTLEASYTTALVIAAWNAYRDNRTLKVLKAAQSGLTRENFPMPR